MHTCNCCNETYNIDKQIGLCEPCFKAFKEYAESFEFPDYDTFENFTQYAEYSNTVLPNLREFSGYKDTMKTGTYTDGNENNDYIMDELLNLFIELAIKDD